MNNQRIETQNSSTAPAAVGAEGTRRVAVTSTDQISSGGSGTRSATVTITQTAPATGTSTATAAGNVEQEVLHLSLRSRPNVTWDNDVIDNEGLGRKSSKRCCIFHKQRSFGESSTDSEDEGGDSDGSGSSSSSGGPGTNHRRIARPKSGDQVPNFQRYHA